MSTQGVKVPPLRGYRRRKVVLDLNVPPIENRDVEGTSNLHGTQHVQANEQGQHVTPTAIDVEALDDDVIESSARAFAEAKSNARRNRGRATVVDLDSGRVAGLPNNNRSRRIRIPPNQPVINCDHYVNLESGDNSVKEIVKPPAPTLKEPTFTCPICMGPLTEEMSTRCGHIFCKGCIKTALATQSKCPTCRKRVIVKELIRVFLPATS
ncbi:E3 ubiquitin-protein ligase RNF4 [Carica papaya]|uniref:E3 ubiquitin-protein ligase RNF4 n=1 Tax=Carica papaya TaxID=3649 RepID=UPI000B8CF5B9|nr:E3 ubiquitin-protein ligase RNF4 [Carica papaya]